MIFNGMFINNDLIGTAMQAAIVRNDVINNNIANAETPGFKKRAVTFESLFQKELKNYETARTVDFSKIEPVIQYEHTGYSYRIDENNVDIEAEMVDLYENSVKYDVLASGIMNNYKRINYVLSNIR